MDTNMQYSKGTRANEEKIVEVLRDAISGDYTQKELAQKHQVAVSSIYYWAKNVGVSLKFKGRKGRSRRSWANIKEQVIKEK